ncbi:ribosomal protein S5, C-terminal domain-containing protein [Polychytrium aggregatum]|uniref:ribosomal protein S5, C-terminal domain-containing protein n=1 Tax=Polychytrium aggregatum TaxID=110093 RepID=UPI0022FF005D|nr:ribosomal protein S5, C-terminal domain-containing protein [Polychytrium aggregatum]KAI9207901.1 ribosomal protein S5, C-terminal domain-containing protein [Polychytrium aggregatum]
MAFRGKMFQSGLLRLQSVAVSPAKQLFGSVTRIPTVTPMPLRSYSITAAAHNTAQQTARTTTAAPQPTDLPDSGSADSFSKPAIRPRAPLLKRVLCVRQVSRTTRNGKVRQSYAMVVVGDQNGSAGYGEGRAQDISSAVRKATLLAEKNMIRIERFHNRTLFQDINYKFKRVNLNMYTAAPGYGIVAHDTLHEVFRCFGIHDVASKIQGSTNQMNIVKGAFEALAAQRTPDDIALARGKRVADVTMTYYGLTNTSSPSARR